MEELTELAEGKWPEHEGCWHIGSPGSSHQGPFVWLEDYVMDYILTLFYTFILGHLKRLCYRCMTLKVKEEKPKQDFRAH